MKTTLATPEKIKISVKNLDFYYGDLRALKDINVDISQNKITAFIGPSGCGKSTLLRVFNRIFDLYHGHRAVGKVMIDGENILQRTKDIALLRAKIGMLFQKPTPFSTSIFENVAFGVKLFESLHGPKLEERVEWALHKAALWNEVKDILNQNGSSLSGGQQQRLCIARSIAIKPEVLLLDEPCSALDPIATAQIEQLMNELAVDHTLIVVTHNMQQASRVSDYTAFMYLGELLEFGTTDKIFTKPDRKETEAYVTGRFG